MWNYKNGKPSGLADVTFATQEEVEEAMNRNDEYISKYSKKRCFTVHKNLGGAGLSR